MLEKDNYVDPYSKVKVSIKLLLNFVDPFNAWNELEKPISIDEVLSAIENGKAELSDTPLVLYPSKETNTLFAREQHINKIAYFVINKAKKPIEIEIDYFDEVSIFDGNHRLCAEIIKKETHVLSNIGGFVDSFNDLLIEK